MKKLTRRNSELLKAFEEKIDAIMKNPMEMGKRSYIPQNTRHIHVKSHWVIWWRVEGKIVRFLDCGRHDDFFQD